MFNLCLFGAPRLEHKGKLIEFDTRKAMALLAYLVVTRQTHSRDALAALLYPDADQTHARASLRRTLSTLNTALSDDTLDIDRETIGLNPRARLAVDVIEFQTIVAQAKAKSIDAQRLTRATDLYRDDFLAGFNLRDSANFDDWQFLTAENLRREFAGALDQLSALHTQQAAYAPAIACARRRLALDPLHEPTHRQLMRLYVQSDQRTLALRQYDECARVVEKELGVAPLEETTRLYQDIKAQRSRAIEERRRKIPPTLPSPAVSQDFPLVGRSSELKTIQSIYAAIRTDGHLIAIEGEAGIGKTRLAEEFLAHARAHGAVVLAGRAYEGETNLVYGIFVEALRALTEQPEWRAKIPPAWQSQVARLMPEIDSAQPPEPLTSVDARSRFYEGISQTIFALARGRVPGVLFCDDVQWADAASLDLLAYLTQRLRGKALCVAATWRNENAAAVERLNALIAPALRAHLATTITLARLAPPAVTQLVAARVGARARITQAISARLHQETEGVPFFVVEYLNVLERGAPQIADWSLPNSARALLHARLASASETGKQLLSAAAVIGRSFDFDTLREASGRAEEEVVRTLEELSAQGLIKEIAAENLRYDFSHDKLRELAYAETSAARRRLLHRRVAETLVNRGRMRRETGALANQIARHYELAGEQALAAEHYQLAGDYARGLYANAKALAHYRAALKLKTAQVSETCEGAPLYESIGDMQTLLGNYADALTSYAAAATAGEPSARARIEHKRGVVYHRSGEYALAEKHFETALAAMGQEVSAATRAEVLAGWSLATFKRGESARAEELAHRALQLAESASDKFARARVRNILGILARHRGEIDQARYHLEQSCAIAETLRDPSPRIAALNNLALVCRDAGEIARAIKLTEISLELCVAQGDRHHQAMLRNNLADLLQQIGKRAQAMAQQERSFAILADISATATTLQPEIWKLIEW